MFVFVGKFTLFTPTSSRRLFLRSEDNRQRNNFKTCRSDWLRVLYTVTVVQGSMSLDTGQQPSREHLLLAAQGNCTFTNSRSSCRDIWTEGGLKAVAGDRGTVSSADGDTIIDVRVFIAFIAMEVSERGEVDTRTNHSCRGVCLQGDLFLTLSVTDRSHCSRTCAVWSRRWSSG